MPDRDPKPLEPRYTQWCHPDVVRRLSDDAARSRHHDRCAGAIGARPCPCPCHRPEETPVPEKIPNPDGTVSTIDLTASTVRAGDVTVSAGGIIAATDGTPETAVRLLTQLADQLDVAMKGYGPEQWTDAVRLLAALRAPLETLKRIDSDVSTWLYLNGEHGIHQQIDGVMGEVAITRGRAGEKWEGDAAVMEYVGRKLTMVEEEPEPEMVAAWVLEVLPTYQPRVTPLKAVGIPVDEYRKSTPGKVSVSITRPT